MALRDESLEATKRALRVNPYLLRHLASDLRGDRAVVSEAVRTRGRTIAFAHPELKRDRALALLSVSQHGNALRYLSSSLRRDREVVMAAVRTTGSSIGYAHVSLRQDREVALAAVARDPWALEHERGVARRPCGGAGGGARGGHRAG